MKELYEFVVFVLALIISFPITIMMLAWQLSKTAVDRWVYDANKK